MRLPAAMQNALEASYHAQAILANIACDLNNGRLASSQTDELFRDVAKSWRRGSLPERCIVGALRAKSARFYGAGPTLASDPGSTRVMNALEFIGSCLNLRGTGISLRDDPDIGLLRRLERGGLSGRLRAGATLPTAGKPIAWVTTTSFYRALARSSTPNDLAAVVREKLGLGHIAADQCLIAVHYPPGHLSKTLHAPTAFDGAENIYFRSTESMSDGWGRAVDLTDASEGGPEAVHSTVPMTSTFTLAAIGKPHRTVIDVDHRRFVSSLPFGWQQLVTPRRSGRA